MKDIINKNIKKKESNESNQTRESENNKHFKLIDNTTNEKELQKRKEQIIQEESEEYSIEPNEQRNKCVDNLQNEQESEHGLSGEESTDSVEYMKFF